MKIIAKLILTTLVAGTMFSCSRKVETYTYESATAPVLTASSTSALVLTSANAANQAIRFDWTNPNYQFSSGLSSQDVTYTLQVDTTGSNFSSPNIQEVAIARELGTSFTVKELNLILTKLNLQENITHNVEFRVRSTLVNQSVPLFSNVVKIVITPYLDVVVPVPPTGELYVTGDGTPSGWTNNPPTGQKCTKVNVSTYYIIMNLSPGFYYKFLSTLNFWQPQYGGSSATGGTLGYNMGGGNDPAAIPTPAAAGSYKVTVDVKLGKYTVEHQ
jgi:starch-binding outer membrane protein SusE/F